MLLQAEPSLLNVCVNNPDHAMRHGMSPLVLACGRFDHEAVKIASLLLDHGAKLDVAGVGGATALTMACALSTAPVVALLLARGANAKTITIDGRTLLHWAGNNGAHGSDIVPHRAAG